MIVIHCGLAVADTVPEHLWSSYYGGVQNESCNMVATDSGENVYIIGYFTGTANFGGSDLVSVGDYDCYLAKYDATGNHLWSRLLGMPSGGGIGGLAVDSSGNPIVTGYFFETANFGGADLVSRRCHTSHKS